jgi:hypothetical protein
MLLFIEIFFRFFMAIEMINLLRYLRFLIYFDLVFWLGRKAFLFICFLHFSIRGLKFQLEPRI